MQYNKQCGYSKPVKPQWSKNVSLKNGWNGSSQSTTRAPWKAQVCKGTQCIVVVCRIGKAKEYQCA